MAYSSLLKFKNGKEYNTFLEYKKLKKMHIFVTFCYFFEK